MKPEFGKIKGVGNIKQIQKRNKMKVWYFRQLDKIRQFLCLNCFNASDQNTFQR